MGRPIKVGSWAHVRLPGRRRFTSEVLRVNGDGSFDVRDTNGNIRAVRPEHLSPANRPKSLR